MASRVEVKRSALRELATLPRRVQEQITVALAALADNPRPPGTVVLTGYAAFCVSVSHATTAWCGASMMVHAGCSCSSSATASMCTGGCEGRGKALPR